MKTGEKIKRTRIVPVLILFAIMTAIVLANQLSIKEVVNTYIVNAKVREGHLAADRIYAQLDDIDLTDESKLDLYCDMIMDHDLQVGTLCVMDGENVLYCRGKLMPDGVMRVKDKKYAIVETKEEVLLSTEENNALVRGIRKKFDLFFGLKPWKENTYQVDERGHNIPAADDYQDIWYTEEVDGLQVTVGYCVPITYTDYQLCVVFSLFFAAAGFLLFALTITIICNVLNSQRKLIASFYKDHETGGYNWHYFTSYVNRKLARMKRHGGSDKYAVMKVDFIKYKSYCSCNGEEAGLELLRDMYATTVDFVPKQAVVARYEGAEFAIFYPYKDEEKLVETVNAGLEALRHIRSDVALSFKAGIYLANTDDVVDASAAYMRAAIACKEAENSVDENALIFDEEMHGQLQWNSKMENDLERGLENHEFEVFLQPKYSCETEKLAAAEALVRWNHPTEGFLTPYRFIPVFESTGLIVKLDDYMLRNVARIQAEYLEKGYPVVPISVNLSRTNFIRKHLARHIADIVDEYHVPHELIEIELTESSFFDDQALIIKTASQLRELGFEVSLDDFGSGYSSLNSLRNIPIDIVKLDAGFFRGQDHDGKGDIIVSEVIQLAKQLDIKIVAEGIEEKSQVDFLREAGCDLIQGYYYAKPMSLEDYEGKYL